MHGFLFFFPSAPSFFGIRKCVLVLFAYSQSTFFVHFKCDLVVCKGRKPIFSPPRMWSSSFLTWDHFFSPLQMWSSCLQRLKTIFFLHHKCDLVLFGLSHTTFFLRWRCDLVVGNPSWKLDYSTIVCRQHFFFNPKCDLVVFKADYQLFCPFWVVKWFWILFKPPFFSSINVI